MRSVLTFAALAMLLALGVYSMPADMRRAVFTRKHLTMGLIGLSMLVALFAIAILQSGTTFQLF